LLKETAGGGFVGNRPAEIDFDFDDLFALHGEDLRIAETTACRTGVVGDEDLVAFRYKMNVLEPLDLLTVRPAALEIRRAIYSVVEWTGEGYFTNSRSPDASREPPAPRQ
jgi:hypothetical protein